DHAGIAEGVRVHDRALAREQVRRKLAGTGPDPEPVPAEAGREEEPGNGLDGRDHRYRVRRDVDHTGPGLRPFDVLQTRVARLEIPERAVEEFEIRLGIEDTHVLEGRGLVERPVARPEQRLPEIGAELQLDVPALV